MTERQPPGFDASSARAMAVIAALALLLAAGWWWTGRSAPADSVPRRTPPAGGPAAAPTAVTPPPTAPTVAATAAPAAAAAPTGPESVGPGGAGATGPAITVDVRGAVRRPGVRQLPPGSRVLDAVAAAGGLRRGSGYGPVNLARPLVDGEQILVGRARPRATAAGAGPGSLPAPGSGQTAPIDINSADAAALEQLAGVGPVLAERIVLWRQQNGRFSTVDDLLDVDGIGEQTLAGLRDAVRVG